MSYKLDFDNRALNEWRKLGHTVRAQFKKKLEARLLEPHSLPDKLSGSTARYKIKLKSSGYRLVYEVDDDRIVVTVITVGRRDRSEVYLKADER